MCARLDRKPPSAVTTSPRKLRLFLERERDSVLLFLGRERDSARLFLERERDSARREPAGVDGVAATADGTHGWVLTGTHGYSDYAAVIPGGARPAGC